MAASPLLERLLRKRFGYTDNQDISALLREAMGGEGVVSDPIKNTTGNSRDGSYYRQVFRDGQILNQYGDDLGTGLGNEVVELPASLGRDGGPPAPGNAAGPVAPDPRSVQRRVIRRDVRETQGPRANLLYDVLVKNGQRYKVFEDEMLGRQVIPMGRRGSSK